MFGFMKNRQKGSVFTVLLAGVAMAGTLSVILYQVISGPMASVVRVSNKTAAKNQLQSISNIVIMDAINLTDNGGDCDNDGHVEPREWREPGPINAPNGGGLIPNNIGAPLTDPWGSDYGYCVWDVGTFNNPDDDNGCGVNVNRLSGTPDPSAGAAETQTVLAVVSAGPDRQFESNCIDYVDATTPVLELGGDDFIQRYTYNEAATATSSLWKLRAGDNTIAEIDKNITVGTPTTGDTMTETSGIIRALAVITEGLIQAGGPLRLSQTVADANCIEANKGDVRYNSTDLVIESCDGTAWRPSGGDSITLTPKAVPFVGVDGKLTEYINDNNTAGDNSDDIPTPSWDSANKELNVGNKIMFVHETGEKPVINNPMIEDLENVTVTNPQDGNILSFNTGVWENTPFPSIWQKNVNDIYYMDGKVGIGTTAPGATLTIESAGSANISVRADGDTNGGVSIIDDTNYPRIYGPANEVFCIGVTGDPVCTSIAIEPGANVGIGTSNPTAKLEVAGNIKGSRFNHHGRYYNVPIAHTARDLPSGVSQSANLYTYGAYGASNAPYAHLGVIGFGEGLSGTIEIAGSWTGAQRLYTRRLRDCCENWSGWTAIANTSDSSLRYKKNIEPLKNSLENILSLRGVEFDYKKEHGGYHSIGFIGEEVGALYPELVNFDAQSDRPDYYITFMDYGNITPVLLEAIKELYHRNEDQTKQLEEKNKSLEARIEALEKLIKEQANNE